MLVAVLRTEGIRMSVCSQSAPCGWSTAADVGQLLLAVSLLSCDGSLLHEALSASAKCTVSYQYVRVCNTQSLTHSLHT